jgi:hypothetical protein
MTARSWGIRWPAGAAGHGRLTRQDRSSRLDRPAAIPPEATDRDLSADGIPIFFDTPSRTRSTGCGLNSANNSFGILLEPTGAD